MQDINDETQSHLLVPNQWNQDERNWQNKLKSWFKNNLKVVSIVAGILIVIAVVVPVAVLSVKLHQKPAAPTACPVVSPTSTFTAVPTTTYTKVPTVWSTNMPATVSKASPQTLSTLSPIITTQTQLAECPPLHLSKHLSASCSDDRRIDSICNFSCIAGYQVEGPSTIFCESSGKWSSNLPTCRNSTCPPCYTGPYCKESTSWKDLEIQIRDTPFTSFKVKYAEIEISCETFLHRCNPFEWRYDCECTDLTSSLLAKCKKYESPAGSCEHALAKLVKSMVALKQYPQPCDPEDMPTSC